MAWRCSQPGPPGLHQVHLHPTLSAALDCGPRGGVQAFLHLPIGAALPDGVLPVDGVGTPAGPKPQAIVQLLRSTMIEAGDKHFRSGRLAVKWYRSEVGPEMHDLLTGQVGKIWTALKATTRVAHVEDSNGRGLPGTRIGPAAHAMVLRDGILLGRPGAHRFRLLDTAQC